MGFLPIGFNALTSKVVSAVQGVLDGCIGDSARVDRTRSEDALQKSPRVLASLANLHQFRINFQIPVQES